jgi:chromosomal replication initiation ATPase DnaA
LDSGPYDHAFYVRIRPSGEPEYSIRIIATDDLVRIAKKRSVQGNLFSFFSQIVEKDGEQSMEQLVGAAKFEEQGFHARMSQFRPLRARFEPTIACVVRQIACATTLKLPKLAADSEWVIIHGTTYEVIYVSGRREKIEFEVYDYPLEAKHFRSPMTYWLEDLVSFVEKVGRKRSADR